MSRRALLTPSEPEPESTTAFARRAAARRSPAGGRDLEHRRRLHSPGLWWWHFAGRLAAVWHRPVAIPASNARAGSMRSSSCCLRQRPDAVADDQFLPAPLSASAASECRRHGQRGCDCVLIAADKPLVAAPMPNTPSRKPLPDVARAPLSHMAWDATAGRRKALGLPTESTGDNASRARRATKEDAFDQQAAKPRPQGQQRDSNKASRDSNKDNSRTAARPTAGQQPGKAHPRPAQDSAERPNLPVSRLGPESDHSEPQRGAEQSPDQTQSPSKASRRKAPGRLLGRTNRCGKWRRRTPSGEWIEPLPGGRGSQLPNLSVTAVGVVRRLAALFYVVLAVIYAMALLATVLAAIRDFFKGLARVWASRIATAQTPRRLRCLAPRCRLCDPFLSGRARRYTPAQLVTYTFQALEAGAADGCPRQPENAARIRPERCESLRHWPPARRLTGHCQIARIRPPAARPWSSCGRSGRVSDGSK